MKVEFQNGDSCLRLIKTQLPLLCCHSNTFAGKIYYSVFLKLKNNIYCNIFNVGIQEKINCHSSYSICNGLVLAMLEI